MNICKNAHSSAGAYVNVFSWFQSTIRVQTNCLYDNCKIFNATYFFNTKSFFIDEPRMSDFLQTTFIYYKFSIHKKAMDRQIPMITNFFLSFGWRLISYVERSEYRNSPANLRIIDVSVVVIEHSIEEKKQQVIINAKECAWFTVKWVATNIPLPTFLLIHAFNTENIDHMKSINEALFLFADSKRSCSVTITQIDWYSVSIIEHFCKVSAFDFTSTEACI